MILIVPCFFLCNRKRGVALPSICLRGTLRLDSMVVCNSSRNIGCELCKIFCILDLIGNKLPLVASY
jgi:hypothetical protein